MAVTNEQVRLLKMAYEKTGSIETAPADPVSRQRRGLQEAAGPLDARECRGNRIGDGKLGLEC